MTIGHDKKTVVLLFTDIEGSTTRWEKDRAAMSRSIQRHNEISRGCVERAGGDFFKLTGDGICAAFDDVDSAVDAVRSIHRDLASEEWPDSVSPVRVRAAVHAGSVEKRDDDYFGPTVNRVARLMSAGHGGQTLLSLSAHELLSDRSGVVDLGEHRLRDLLRAEHIFQLGADEFPPLRTLEVRRNNLPIQVNAFVGRERELAEIGRSMDEARLLTLSGPGGTGKTRLALQVVAEKLSDFDAVYFVDLANVMTEDGVLSAIGDAIGVSLARADDEETALAHAMASEEALLVLDNFEHVIGAGPAVGRLLEKAPSIRALVTSRELLRVKAEHNYPVSPLELPATDEAELDAIGRVEAVSLFIERALAVKPDFVLDSSNAEAIVAICRRLDGLPLAIELAAARLRLFTPERLLSALEDSLSALGAGPRDSPTRQRTLQGAVRWSIDLLETDQRRMLDWLSVFVGGASMDAIEEVILSDTSSDLFELLGALVDKSLIRADTTNGETRIQMLETVRAVTGKDLDAIDDGHAARLAHASYFADLAERAEPELRQKNQSDWIRILTAEWPNIEAAIQWSFESGDPVYGLRLVAGLRDYWFYSGGYRPMGQWSEVALRHVDGASGALRAGVYLTAGFHLYGIYEPRAIDCLAEAASCYEEVGDSAHLALALLWHAGACLAMSDEAEDWESEMERAIELARESGAMHIVGQAFNMWGELEREKGNYQRAQEIQEEALQISREIGEQLRVAMVLNNLGLIARHLGDDEKAKRLIQESMELTLRLDFPMLLAHCLISYAEQLTLDGFPNPAARLIGTAEAYFERSGYKPQPADAPDFDRIKELVRGALDADSYQRLHRSGAGLSMEDAARRLLGETMTPD